MPWGQAAEDPSLELEEAEDDPADPEELFDEPLDELFEEPGSEDEPDDESPLLAGTDADDPLRESVR